MYSCEERLKAVKLYIQYDLSAASVIRELGYPDYKSLIAWYKQYIETGKLINNSEPYTKYTDEQRSIAVKHYLEHGKCISRTCRVLGYPSRPLLTQWIKEDVPEEENLTRIISGIKHNNINQKFKVSEI